MKKSKKNPFPLSTLLFFALLLAGLGVLFYPTLSDLYIRHQIQAEIRQYNQVLEAEQADYSAFWEAAESYNRALTETENRLTPDVEERARVYDLLNPNDTNILGYIEIPAIGVELPIYRGTEEKQLQSGAGWWIGTSLPTGGPGTHCVITAHTGLAKAKMFTDLDQLVIGDRFTVTVLDRELTYEVDQILVTEPGDVEPLDIAEGEDYVTLYTCTPYGVNTHRLLVRGSRVQPEAEPDPAPEEAPDQTLSPWLALLLIPAAGLAALAALYVRGMTRHGKREFPKHTDRK